MQTGCSLRAHMTASQTRSAGRSCVVMTLCYVPVMTTTQRTVRVDDELWEAFDAACSALGTNKSARLIQHIENDVEEFGVTNEGSK